MFKLAHIRIAEEELKEKEALEWGEAGAPSEEPTKPIVASKSSSTASPKSPSGGRSLMCHPIWILGAVCVALGSILDLVSFAFASVSLLAPLGAMTLVLNMFMAPLFLKEKLTSYDVKCTLVILVGTVVAISFGNKNNTSYTLNELLNLYSQLAFLVYLGVFFVILVIGIIFMFRATYRLDHPEEFRDDDDVLNRAHRCVCLVS